VWRPVQSVIEWVRAGYPDEAPRTGYSPLLALMGPISMTRSQLDRIVRELDARRADPIDVQVAIAKITGRLPSEAQTRAVMHALRAT
jgi:uncharacterized protein DUF3349